MAEVERQGGQWLQLDVDKAMKAIYEVVEGEGAGARREAERFLPLGTDTTAQVKTVQVNLNIDE